MTICLNFPNWSPPLPLSMSQPCYSALPTPRPVPLCLHYMHNPLCHYVCVCSTFYHSDIRGTFVKIRELQYTVAVLLNCTLARNCDAELHCEVRVKYNAVISAPTSDLPVLLPPSTLPITSNPFLEILPNSGVLILKSTVQKETNPTLDLTVVATDNGLPARKSSIVVKILVSDKNEY